MNRGYALSRSQDTASLEAAIMAYTEAIQILNTLPSESDLSNALGAALMNRGQLRHQLHGTEHSHLAIDDFHQSTEILRASLSQSSPWPRRNLVGTLLNHANLLLDLGQAREAMLKAEAAIAAHTFAHPTDPTDCELSILAARSYCDAIGQLLPERPPEEQTELASQAFLQVDHALSHIRALRPYVTEEPFAAASIRLFHFGVLLLATHRPAQLDRFIHQHFDSLGDDKIRPHLVASAQQSIPVAIDQIQKDLLAPETTFPEQDQLADAAQQLAFLHQQLPNL